MRMPRKAVLIRLAIYLPLLGYFGWRAFDHYRAERASERDPPQAQESVELADPFEGMPTKTIDVDGKQVKVYEITPEQAEAYLGVEPNAADAADAAATPGEGTDG